MRIGFVLSAGGSSFFEVMRQLPPAEMANFAVIVSRACDAEKRADELGVERVRATGRDRRELSLSIADHASRLNLGALIFMFDRLVSRDLFERIPCINIHPSLLPAFAGMNATERALQAGVSFSGCTAHMIDDGVDTGPILAQVSAPVPAGADLSWANHQAFRQKAMLVRQVVERISDMPCPLTPEALVARFGFQNQPARPT